MRLLGPEKFPLLDSKHSCLLGTDLQSQSNDPVQKPQWSVPQEMCQACAPGSSSCHDLTSYCVFCRTIPLTGIFFKEDSRSICCRKEQESYFPLVVNQMNNHRKEKFHSQHWTFCNNHGKHSSRAPLQLQILHRSITNVLQNTLKIKLHCQVIEFCASGMLLALHFFLINVKHPVILKRFSHRFLNLPTPLDGIAIHTHPHTPSSYKYSFCG